MKKDLKEKLKSYSIAAGAVLSAGSADAGIVYTDINPDQTFSANGSSYNLDLNNDATVDFNIRVSKTNYTFTSFTFSSFRVTATPYGSNEVAASGSYYALALVANNQISGALGWGSYSSLLMASKFRYSSTFSTFSSSNGLWTNATNKYLGLKLKVSTNTYYGWARLDLNMSSKNFTIKDYAYENTNNTSILAGQLPTASKATSVVATDVDDNADGSDMQVDFNKAADENTVNEYRIMVVKFATAGSFDATAAQAVSAANYEVVIPNGSNVSMTLSSTANDVDGDPVELGVAYKVFVLSEPDGTLTTQYGLSNPSATITLNTAPSASTNLSGADISNNADGSDLEVSFNRIADEYRISEYRVIVMPAGEAAGFDLSDAESVTSGNYISITPTGSHIKQALPAAAKDKNGVVILENVTYKFFVMSVANGSDANLNSLSAESNSVMLIHNVGIEDEITRTVKVFSYSGNIQIDLGEFSGKGHAMIFDASGRNIFNQALNNKVEVITPESGNGVYLIRLDLNGTEVTRKVFLE